MVRRNTSNLESLIFLYLVEYIYLLCGRGFFPSHKKTYYMNNKVCDRANRLQGNRSDAFTQSWKAEKLRHRMRVDVVKFTYIKKNGVIRTAVGTTHPLVVPASLSRSTKKQNPAIVTYYDLQRKAWRSCRVLSIVEIIF